MSMRKSIFRTIIAALVSLLVMTAAIVPAFAADSDGSDEYGYMIRIYAGAQGTISSFASKNGVAGTVEEDGSVVVFRDVKKNDQISFQNEYVTLTNEKYYVKGMRESGKDNYDLAAQATSITVNGDMDYVVSYAMKGQSVAYTVNYVGTDGSTLLESQTYYGNVGDEPVVAFRYIEGYFPQAYNLTGIKLDADASKNVYTFVYQSVEARVVQGETTTAETTTAANAADNANAANTNAVENLPGTGIGNGDVTLPGNQDEVPDVVDINNGTVPQAAGPGGTEETTTAGSETETTTSAAPSPGTSTLTWVLAGIGIAAAIALAIFLIIFLTKRRNKE